LRKVVGAHAHQKGSLVEPSRLRFDVTHFAAFQPEELRAAEDLVREKILENLPVETIDASHAEAIEMGAMALFGEKYGDQVRVLSFGDFSTELCGGTHVRRTGDISFFKIASEESIAAGVRRIVALTGPKAVELSQREAEELRRAAGLLKAGAFEVAQKVEQAQRRVRDLERALEEASSRIAAAQSGDLAARAKEVAGAKVLAARVQGDGKSLRELADKLRDKLGKGVVALGAEQDGKAILLVAVTKDLTAKVKAGDLVKEGAKLVGGSGGGKPDLAQAGGPDAAGIEKALQAIEVLASRALA
jgi:alanyl-tRNA synthetase